MPAIALKQQVAGAFPFRRASRGFATATGLDLVHQGILAFLGTQIGEYPMDPLFGWNKDRWLWEPIDQVLAGGIKSDLGRGLELWFPQVQVLDIPVELDAEDHSVVVAVRYSVRATKAIDTVQDKFSRGGGT